MTSVDALARLIAASQDLNNKGMVNLQKLLEALVFSVIRVQARTFRRRDDAAARIQEIDALLAELPSDVVTPAFKQVLERCLKRYQIDPTGDLRYTDAPDIFVCRNCGQATVGEAPQECPVCGSSYGVFRRFQGLFNGDNAEPENPFALLQMLDQNAAQVESLVLGLPERDCIRHPFPGRWSIREQVTHFYDTQMLLEARVSLMLAEDEPFLGSVAAYTKATENEGRPAQTSEIMRMYKEARSAFTAKLREVAPALLWRRGRHEDFGLVSIMHQVKYFAHHEQSHMGSIAALRRAVV